MELKSGHAEIFRRTELVINTKYQFESGSKFTYQGWTVLLSGKMEVDP